MAGNQNEDIQSNNLKIKEKNNSNKTPIPSSKKSQKIDIETLDASLLKSKINCHVCEQKLGKPVSFGTPYNLRRHLLSKHAIEVIGYKAEGSKGGRPYKGGKKASRRRAYLKKTAGKIKPKDDLQKRKHSEYIKRAIKKDLHFFLDFHLQKKETSIPQKARALRVATTSLSYFSAFHNSFNSFMGAITAETALDDDFSVRFRVMSEILHRVFEILPKQFNSENEDIDDTIRFLADIETEDNVDDERVDFAYDNMKPFFDNTVNTKQIDNMIKSTVKFIYLVMGSAEFTAEGIEKHQPAIKSIFKEGAFSFEHIF